MGAAAPPSNATAQGKKILVCVAGGIAAFKVVSVVRSFAEMGADVRVVMTRSAHHFIGAQTFAALSGNPVATEMFASGADVPHVELARGADLAIVAPATANGLAKMALGFADDLFSAVLLTVRAPVVIAPAMHTEMWEHPATHRNVTLLEERGGILVGPSEGALSSGDRGAGRMAEPDEIVTAGLGALGRAGELAGIRALVTAGGTQEPIDPVRFVGNRSSGRMGFAIAREAAARGAKVTVVTGVTSAEPPPGVDLVPVATADEMRAAVLERAPECDVIVKAAAVADFKPKQMADRKLKKASGPPEITLIPTPDILAELGSTPGLRKPQAILVGFAAETEPDPGRLGQLAEEKRRSKGADVIVANDVSSSDSGFGSITNRAVIASPDGLTDVGLVTKTALASALIERISQLLQESRTP
ncbi:MAG: bifunctional phosphopantothenoylcysteine decarboxylase/phosphopantothenate--cysteine ligase CoaBC [Actinobacteria bacterium]|nr:bifunctional phosphopantothenoylcysteine decarboxylase/phosphopantothenate--cysteine ligase CoaBC [Actinomycetota bacterium]